VAWHRKSHGSFPHSSLAQLMTEIWWEVMSGPPQTITDGRWGHVPVSHRIWGKS
jgi:hypothetical protein